MAKERKNMNKSGLTTLQLISALKSDPRNANWFNNMSHCLNIGGHLCMPDTGHIVQFEGNDAANSPIWSIL